MVSLADYFAKERYQPKYEFGTRVFGRWHKIPFIGTIYGDSVISELEGPRLTIELDLPLMFDKKVYNRIIDTHKNVKEIKRISELVFETEAKIPTSRKTSTSQVKSTLNKPKKAKK